MQNGDMFWFLLAIGLALFFSEMQVRTEAGFRWICLATLGIIAMAMLMWLAAG